MEEENIQNILLTTPNDLDCIETNLWLGNLEAASNVKLLEEKKINFILTVNSFPLHENVSKLENIKQKYVEVSDSPTENILSWFEETYQFIENGVKSGAVLVHCYFGMSRSATVVIAYLMKKNKLKLQSALKYVQSKRNSVLPNPGFLDQLQLYETMSCTLDKNNVQYKMFKLSVAREIMRRNNLFPETPTDVIKGDPSLITVKSDASVYKCRKCRRMLALSYNILPHASKQEYNWKDNRWSKSDGKDHDLCEELYFFEPLAWMKCNTQANGHLQCPNDKCQSKLGSFSWITGCHCPCGTKVSPAFYLIPSKVDKRP